MEETIGQAAGQIWEALQSSNQPVNITEVAKMTKLKTQIAYQGLGWLAREGKVSYHTNGAKTLVSLVGIECTCC